MGLYCCVQASEGYSLAVVHKFLIMVASVALEHRLRSSWAFAVVVQRLRCSAVCGIFPDQGRNPCRLQWQIL